MDTAHRSTPCQVLAHPATNAARVFEVRRMARDAGCQFITSSKRNTRWLDTTSSTSPFGGAA